MAWFLLLAALAQPGWALAHALVHEHLEHHHSAQLAAAHEARVPHVQRDERAPHDHGHLDEALLRTGRSLHAAQFAMLPAALPTPVAAAVRPDWIVAAGAPPRASPEFTDPSHPRAPPNA